MRTARPDTPCRARRPDYQLRVLGSFELRRADRIVPVTPSAQRLLALLATRLRPATRTGVSAALWPEFPDQRAGANLRSTLWRLRRDYAAELVHASSDSMALAAGVAVDVRQIQQAVAALSALSEDAAEPAADAVGPSGAVRAEVLDPEALSQDILQDWPEDWLIPIRESFRQVRLHALDLLCEQRCSRGGFTAALEAGMVAIACEPLRESAHRAVARVHLAEGNPAEALRQYEVYRRLLQTELGLPPSQRFRRLIAPLLGRPLDGVLPGGRTAEASHPT